MENNYFFKWDFTLCVSTGFSFVGDGSAGWLAGRPSEIISKQCIIAWKYPLTRNHWMFKMFQHLSARGHPRPSTKNYKWIILINELLASISQSGKSEIKRKQSQMRDGRLMAMHFWCFRAPGHVGHSVWFAYTRAITEKCISFIRVFPKFLRLQFSPDFNSIP